LSGDVPRANQFFVGRFRLLELGSIFRQFALGRLEPQSGLTGRVTVIRTQERSRLRAEFALFDFEFLNLGNQPFAETGVRSQTLIILCDLLA
jgi:hypothetical protein